MATPQCNSLQQLAVPPLHSNTHCLQTIWSCQKHFTALLHFGWGAGFDLTPLQWSQGLFSSHPMSPQPCYILVMCNLTCCHQSINHLHTNICKSDLSRENIHFAATFGKVPGKLNLFSASSPGCLAVRHECRWPAKDSSKKCMSINSLHLTSQIEI